MRAIYKFPAGGSVEGMNVGLAIAFSVKMPAGASILDVQMQGQEPQLWALVQTDAPEVRREFRWCATGQDLAGVIDDTASHVGTIQWGRFVFHLFELRPKGRGHDSPKCAGRVERPPKVRRRRNPAKGKGEGRAETA